MNQRGWYKGKCFLKLLKGEGEVVSTKLRQACGAVIVGVQPMSYAIHVKIVAFTFMPDRVPII